MRTSAVALWFLLVITAPLMAEVRVDMGAPGGSIGFDLRAYPELSPIPDHPVYYAPHIDANLFYFGGRYWAFSHDGWYSSTWYNGPWEALSDDDIPLFVLRVPVRYYRHTPVYFRGWLEDAPPRWADHFGPAWADRHRDWEQWDRALVPRLAPLPDYQRDYGRARYPPRDEQRALHERHYGLQDGEEGLSRVGHRAAPVAMPSPIAGTSTLMPAATRPMRDERAHLAPRFDAQQHTTAPRQFIKRERDPRPAPRQRAAREASTRQLDGQDRAR